MTEQIALLEQKNKSLSSELDKVTCDLFAANDTITELKNQLSEKKHSEQLAAWAIDRALETAKLPETHRGAIVVLAEGYCNWIKASSAKVAA